MNNSPKAVIMIQEGEEGDKVISTMLDEHRIIRNQQYLYFSNFGPDVERSLSRGTLQLVVTSHTDTLDADDVARKVILFNPTALVFAFTSNPDTLASHSFLDGVIDKMDSRSWPMVRKAINLIHTGCPRENLLAFITYK